MYKVYACKYFSEKARIYLETNREGPTNFEMFTVQNTSDQQPSATIE